MQIPPWLPIGILSKIFNALAEHGESRLVGGCVRNTILNIEATDIDIATTITPELGMSALKKIGAHCIPTGVAHGTFTAILNENKFEITTLRKDIKTDGRHAIVTYSTDFEEDSNRRDFTMNALYMDLQGQIYDYHNGLKDLHNRHIKFIGNAQHRITEDYLRILRFFRFYSTHAQSYDEEEMTACFELRAGIAQLSGERIKSELFKILASPKALKTLKLMSQHEILQQFGLSYSNNLKNISPDPLANLAALAPISCELQQRIVLTNKEKRFINQLPNLLELTSKVVDLQNLDHPIQQMKLQYIAQDSSPRLLAYLYAIDKINPKVDILPVEIPKFPLSGEYFIQQGLHGKEIAAAKMQAELQWLLNDFALNTSNN